MKIRPIVIGMVACVVLPLAGANAQAVLDPALNQAGAVTDLGRGAARTAENFGRNESEDHGNQGNQGDHGNEGDHGNHCGLGDKGDRGNKDHDCEKSPSKPH